MARRTVDTATFPSLVVEGNLLSSAILGAVYARDAEEQTPEGYGVRQGLSLRDEFSLSFRVAQAHFDKFARLRSPGRTATAGFMRGLLTEAFAFSDLADGPLPLSLVAGGGRVPIVIVPPGDDLDRPSDVLSEGRRRSAALALQDHLNDREEALWGLASNGTKLRLMRDNASFTRPAHIEADLAQIFENEDFASFATLWLLIHRSRFGEAGAAAADCALERWRDAGARQGEAARDRLAGQVQDALRTLGSGFLAENEGLRTRIETGHLGLTDFFNELLQLVYRLIFLMVAEDRAVLHPDDDADHDAREIYARGYSLASLRRLALRRSARDRHHDRFEGMKVVFTGLTHGRKHLALPALGGLFAGRQMPALDSARLPNHAFLEALFKLGWFRQDDALVPVNWRVMETEELGSVYESLLELQPQIEADGRTLIFASDAAETKGNQRKTTGSYYTPDSLVQALLDTALDPVLDKTEAEADDPAEALLDLAIIDPACGSGHFLLAAARRIATRVARHRAEGTPSAADFRHALRDAARRCIHGVDRNPMAVELTKVALWIETVDPGLPLGFFDAQIRCGDALLGVFDLKALEDGIPDAAYKPLTGDDKAVARYYGRKNGRESAEKDHIAKGFGLSRAHDLLRDFEALRAMPEQTVEQIEAKAARLSALTAKGATAWQLETACDLYVAAFLLPKTTGGPYAGPDGLPRRGVETVPTSGTVWEWLRGVQVFGPLFGQANEAAHGARAFHWPLKFPDIMGRGGFDVVLGNPPWEVMQLSEVEYFAATKPEIAELAGAKRKKAINALSGEDPAVYAEFLISKRYYDAANKFARASGRFNLTARGKVNTYSLFAELFDTIVNENGRAGVIVPTGIATDPTTALFFAHLLRKKRLASLVDFENRGGLFPAVDSRMKFCLLTVGQNEPEARFAFFLTESAQLAESERNFTLSPEQIAAINPNTRTAPVFRTKQDAFLTAKICARGTALIDINSNHENSPFDVLVIQNFFTSSNKYDAELFEKYLGQDKDATLLPVKRGGSIWHYDHRFDAPVEIHFSEQDWRGQDRFAPRKDVIDRLLDKGWQRDWMIGWRDIARATDERTVVAAVLPITASDDTLSLLLPMVEPLAASACLLANLNSLVMDYVAQSKVGGTHIRKNVIAQFPILRPDYFTETRLAFIVPKVLELTYTSHTLAPFARDLGHDGPPFTWDEDRRAHLRADLDVFYARAYGLTRDELRYILDPADMKGPDYPSETFRVLKEKEIRRHGEYRTRRLVLEAWDRMAADGTFRSLDL